MQLKQITIRREVINLSDQTQKIQCSIHGESYVTFVCGHLANNHSAGFYSDSDSSDPRPDAWCYECDCRLLKDGEWNDKNEAFAEITVLCAGCYDSVRNRNAVTRPSIEIDGWVLGHQQDVRKISPLHVFPTPEEVECIQPNTQVKLLFLIMDTEKSEIQGECMWVKVLNQIEDGYIGLLKSYPFTNENIKKEQILTFASEQILEVASQNIRSKLGLWDRINHWLKNKLQNDH